MNGGGERQLNARRETRDGGDGTGEEGRGDNEEEGRGSEGNGVGEEGKVLRTGLGKRGKLGGRGRGRG